MLRHIELIDEEAALYGIKMVKSTDKLIAKKYGFRQLPGISYFRKGKLIFSVRFLLNFPKIRRFLLVNFFWSIIAGKYINYDGDIDDEEELLDWLTNPDNMQLTDRIESVNRKMFQKIRQTSDYVAVFFCEYFPIFHARHVSHTMRYR